MRTAGIYGPQSSRCVIAEGGLLQQPSQIASTMLFLAKQDIRTYAELGVFAGWTATVVSTYLSRFAPRGSLSGFAIDVTLRMVAGETRTLLQANNIKLEKRRPAPHLRRGTQIDLCFIDGDHHYAPVLADFEEFAPSCRLVAFHDIVDFDCAMGDQGDGVPRFWADLKANLNPADYVEFIQQPGVFPPSLGIGVLLNKPALPLRVASTRTKKYAVLRELVPTMGKYTNTTGLVAQIAQAHGPSRNHRTS